jgi:predicted metal-binding membrane protein
MTSVSQSFATIDTTARRARPAAFSLRRVWPAAPLVVLVGACWAYLIATDIAMRRMDFVAMAMPSADRWSSADFALVATMWVVMMVAMMVPSAMPMLVAHRQVLRARGPSARPDVHGVAFLSGYLFVWLCGSVLATFGQWAAHNALLVSPSMVITKPPVAGALLVAAGVYQWTPVKRACLRRCASPIAFLVQHWRDGMFGALRMGVAHGVYCLGCCWLLMTLMLVYGAMNFVWMVAVAAAVLAEKLLPAESLFSKVLGGLLVGWGLIVAFG